MRIASSRFSASAHDSASISVLYCPPSIGKSMMYFFMVKKVPRGGEPGDFGGLSNGQENHKMVQVSTCILTLDGVS